MRHLLKICSIPACLTSLVLILGFGNAQAGIAVIVSSSSPVSKLSAGRVRQIFLGKVRRIHGTKMVAFPIDQSTNSAIRIQFSRRVIKMSPEQQMKYWSRRIFSGKGGLPTVVGSSAQVLRLVRANRNAIGYVFTNEVGAGVKSILTLR